MTVCLLQMHMPQLCYLSGSVWLFPSMLGRGSELLSAVVLLPSPSKYVLHNIQLCISKCYFYVHSSCALSGPGHDELWPELGTVAACASSDHARCVGIVELIPEPFFVFLCDSSCGPVEFTLGKLTTSEAALPLSSKK